MREFPTPDVNYVAVAVDVTQNPYCLPNQYTLPQNIQTLEFIAGTEPTQTCTEPTSLQAIPVPSVVGLSQAAAMTILADAGFYVKVVLAISTQPAGTVISQSPSAGVSAFQTSSVMITVSKDLVVAEPIAARPPRPRETNGSSATENRHACSIPTRMPTRGPATMRAFGTGVPSAIHRSWSSDEVGAVERAIHPERLAELGGPRTELAHGLAVLVAPHHVHARRSARPRGAAPPSPPRPGR